MGVWPYKHPVPCSKPAYSHESTIFIYIDFGLHLRNSFQKFVEGKREMEPRAGNQQSVLFFLS